MGTNLISNSKRDRLLTKCESLMLQGVDSPSQVSEELNISFNTAKSYIALVRGRWTSSLSVDELQTRRQELIRRTEEIAKEAWMLKGTAKNTTEAVAALRTALMCVERLEKLQGLNSLPLPVERPPVNPMYELAQKINALPPEEKQKYVLKIKEVIRRRKAEVIAVNQDKTSLL